MRGDRVDPSSPPLLPAKPSSEAKEKKFEQKIGVDEGELVDEIQQHLARERGDAAKK